MVRVRYIDLSKHWSSNKLKIMNNLLKHLKILIFKNMYCTRAIITRGLYTFYPIFEDQKRFLRSFFGKILTLCKDTLIRPLLAPTVGQNLS